MICTSYFIIAIVIGIFMYIILHILKIDDDNTLVLVYGVYSAIAVSGITCYYLCKKLRTCRASRAHKRRNSNASNIIFPDLDFKERIQIFLDKPLDAFKRNAEDTLSDVSSKDLSELCDDAIYFGAPSTESPKIGRMEFIPAPVSSKMGTSHIPENEKPPLRLLDVQTFLISSNSKEIGNNEDRNLLDMENDNNLDGISNWFKKSSQTIVEPSRNENIFPFKNGLPESTRLLSTESGYRTNILGEFSKLSENASDIKESG